MEAGKDAEKQARVEALNHDLAGWSIIWNNLRGNADFELCTNFLWRHVFEEIYKQEMPRDTKLAIEVTADAGKRLQKLYPQNTESVDDGQQIKYFLNVDHPQLAPVDDPKNARRVEISLMGGPIDFKFGLTSYFKGNAFTEGHVLDQGEIVGFQIKT